MNITAGKFLLGILAAGIIFSSALLAQGEGASSWSALPVLVRQGDTVWDIACEHTVAGEDVRTVVERIYSANELLGRPAIQPGQILLVPLRGAQ